VSSDLPPGYAADVMDALESMNASPVLASLVVAAGEYLDG
jgi:hypothetical protein